MMAKEAHTPGPWEIDGATVFALDERGHVNRFSASVQGGYVSYLRFSPRSKGERTSDAELEANARLMAAAPELLEALAGLQHHVTRHACTWDDAENASHHHPVWAKVANAIAKARGGAA